MRTSTTAGLALVVPIYVRTWNAICFRDFIWGICFWLLFAFLSVSAEERSLLADPPDEKRHWFSLGVGGSSTHAPDTGSGAVKASYSYRLGKGVLTGRFIYAEQSDDEENISGVGRTKVRPLEHTSDFGMLYGWFTRSPRVLASLSSGLSVLEGVRCGELISFERQFLYEEYAYEEVSYTTFALPVEAQVYWTPLRSWGFGVCAFVDFNEEKRFSGVLLSVLLQA